MKVAIVGGGLTGLATAWRLRDDAEVVVLEADERAGGQVHSIELAGRTVDVGADAMLARQPEAVALARDAGFGDDDLVAPATGQVRLWVRDQLRPLPEGTVLGAPSDLVALARSGVLPPVALARAAIEPLLRRRQVVGDRSVADLVGERFGRDVVDLLVEPLLGGVYAGDAAALSASAAAAPVWAAAQASRSLTLGLRAHRRRAAASPVADEPVFRTLRGGLGRLIDRLAADLGDRLRLATPVVELRHEPEGWHLTTTDGEVVADQVVLALPARPAAALLARVVPAAAHELAAIRTASVAVVALAYDAATGRHLPDGSGLLVPRTEGRLIKAATFSSRKWPHLAGGEHTLLRASVGRVDDPRGLELSDDELAERVDAEVRWATGLPRPAVERRVRRWPAALPQYDVGHLTRVDRLRHAVRTGAPGLHVAGASLDGVGLAARAREAATLAETLRTTSTS